MENNDNKLDILTKKIYEEGIEKAQHDANDILEKAKKDADNIIKEAEAKANQLIAQSITQGLIDKIEAEARLKHGWIEITGASSIVVKD